MMMHYMPYYNQYPFDEFMAPWFDDVDHWSEGYTTDENDTSMNMNQGPPPSRRRGGRRRRQNRGGGNANSVNNSNINNNNYTPPQNWKLNIPVFGFRTRDVTWDVGQDNGTVKIHAHHPGDEEDGNCAEFHRTIQVPDFVDRTRLKVNHRPGGVIIKAPYLNPPQPGQQPPGQGQGTGQQQGQLQSIQQQQMRRGSGGGNDPWSLMPWATRDWHSLTEEMRNLQNELLQLHQQSFPGTMASNIVKGEDGNNKLYLDFNMTGYQPDEINVIQEGNTVVIEARHEKETDGGLSLKHFKRIFTLPTNVNADGLSSKLLSDGRLRLEAPCELKEEENKATDAGGREIPVKRSTKGQE